eukprot:Sspe_Gene.118620::Locus_112448_Transcript_1_1_Confidence_1.000_Length_349::g.118620::m.118620
MDFLREQWWGGGLLSLVRDGDQAGVEQLLRRAGEGELEIFRFPGDVPLDRTATEEERQVASRRRRAAAVNAKNDDGFTALHIATLEGHRDLIKWVHASNPLPQHTQIARQGRCRSR